MPVVSAAGPAQRRNARRIAAGVTADEQRRALCSVGMSAVSMMSLTPSGMPSIGDNGRPARQRSADRSLKVKNGDVTEGISLLRSGSAAYRATGAEMWMSHYTALLASACEIAGQIEEAVTQSDVALQIVERTGERWFAAELSRHQGQLLLRQGHAEAAEELYRKALSIAQEQDARLWELRAAVSLARLRGEQGRREEARDLLSPVYGWFTEGFDTPDLREAKVTSVKLVEIRD